MQEKNFELLADLIITSIGIKRGYNTPQGKLVRLNNLLDIANAIKPIIRGLTSTSSIREYFITERNVNFLKNEIDDYMEENFDNPEDDPWYINYEQFEKETDNIDKMDAQTCLNLIEEVQNAFFDMEIELNRFRNTVKY
jgi:hypothetical protein